MMNLSTLKAPPGARKTGRRVGRGEGSGRGKTSGWGHKGQRSRAGKKINPDFEGGQMSLIRRLPKFGFTNIWRKSVAIVNLQDLNNFKDGESVDLEALKKKGLVHHGYKGAFKILGKGELKKSLMIKATAFSSSAKTQIEKVGGKAEVIK